MNNYNLCPFILKPNGHFEVAALFKVMIRDDTQRKTNWNRKKAFRPTS